MSVEHKLIRERLDIGADSSGIVMRQLDRHAAEGWVVAHMCAGPHSETMFLLRRIKAPPLFKTDGDGS